MTEAFPNEAVEVVRAGLQGEGPIVFLTGAGISAESGIPTFRGAEGYWQAGGRNYFPQDLATRAAFDTHRRIVWSWYLYRRSVCRAARPNPGHAALVAAEARLGERFRLVTQNVDGLHLRAGNAPERVWQIHGNVDRMRCLDACSPALYEVPIEDPWPRDRAVTGADLARLVCPACGGPARPHVLWFDEYYDETLFKFDSSLRVAQSAAMLVVVGTSGATNLPIQMGRLAARRQIPMVVVNVDESPFSAWARENPNGVFLQGRASTWLPPLVDLVRGETAGDEAGDPARDPSGDATGDAAGDGSGDAAVPAPSLEP